MKITSFRYINIYKQMNSAIAEYRQSSNYNSSAFDFSTLQCCKSDMHCGNRTSNFFILIFSQASNMQYGTLPWQRRRQRATAPGLPHNHKRTADTIQCTVLPMFFVYYIFCFHTPSCPQYVSVFPACGEEEGNYSWDKTQDNCLTVG